MAEINTLSQFLTAAKTSYQVYDLGRRVQHIDMIAFEQIEALKSPYPYPVQGHAHMALVFWDASQQHFVWFIKLPLDEQGMLSPAPRSQFIQMIIDALGRDPTKPLTEDEQQTLANHPFNFKPSQEKLALFNALVRKLLGLRASTQYEFAAQYLAGECPQAHWQQLGFQGLADICVRAAELDHSDRLVRALTQAPPEVQRAICQCLEHLTPPDAVAQTLFDRFNATEGDEQLYFLRALAGNTQLAIQAVNSLIGKAPLNADTLVTIAARVWLVLRQDALRLEYLESLALQPQTFFNQVFADIVAIPSLRSLLLSDLRRPERSQALTEAVGGLFRATRK
ncbi:DUF3549 family protein [Shewanella cyperi]|uniref:DUF3549 family protein n=1 Tax=Shewanella cyperi TaxID=2814292 RepID=A0A975AL51_9GAMM|nr:DUF3549 family protein [Shewanella cyperi]QSX31062.1 DUF3549 family protein [Shewanella cyperi]